MLLLHPSYITDAFVSVVKEAL